MQNELTAKENLVLSILCDPAPVRAVAVAHNVSEGTVRNIKMLRTKIAQRVRAWALINRHPVPVHVLEPQRRFTAIDIAAIRRSTETSEKLAEAYCCAPSTIRMIKTRKTYAGVA